MSLVNRTIEFLWNIQLKILPFVPQQPTLVEIDQTPQQPTLVDLDNR